MTDDVVEDTYWKRFVFQSEQHKKLAGISSDASSHLLACLSTKVYNAQSCGQTLQTF
jgi:bifunctional pyridoxal-dependent enzyme with beta-cystathionase and maltose regulon repressor activities